MKTGLCAVLLYFIMTTVMAAEVSTCSFTSSTGTYTPLTTETVLWSGIFDDGVSASITFPGIVIGSNTYFNLYVSSNGFITMGDPGPSNLLYNPISDAGSYGITVSPFGGDLVNAASGSPKISYNTNVNGETVIQWQDVRPFGTAYSTQRISFQVRLNPSTMAITFCYGGTIVTSASSSNYQVGLRGFTPLDYNNRKTLSNWSATSTGSSSTASCAFTQGISPANGLTYQFLPCPVVNPYPYKENFDASASLPSCWANVNTAGTSLPGTWDWQSIGINPVCSPHSESGMARFNSWNYGVSTTGILASEQFYPAGDPFEVHFWMYRNNGHSTAGDLVNVYYNGYPNTSGATLIGTVHRSSSLSPTVAVANSWYEYVFNIPSGTYGGTFIVFEGVSAYGENIFIDDVKVKPVFTCPSGSTPEAEICGTSTNDGCSMATPAFEPISNGETKCGTIFENANLFDSDWYKFTVAEKTDITLSGLAEFPLAITCKTWPCNLSQVVSSAVGPAYSQVTTEAILDPGTYVAYVTTTSGELNPCGEDNKYYLAMSGVPCPLRQIPFSESFDGSEFAPPCWQNVSAGTGSSTFWEQQAIGFYPNCWPHSGAAMAMFASYTLAPGTAALLITPQIAMPSDQYEVHFWMFRDGSTSYLTYPDKVNVYYNTIPGKTGATMLGTVNRSSSLPPAVSTPNLWYEYTYNVPAGSSGNAYFIFEGVSQYGNNIYLDDVNVRAVFNCPAGSTAEAEPCGTDLNGGCNLTPPAFEPIGMGSTKCGTTWYSSTYRDTDWYSFTLSQKTLVTLSGYAEFPAVINLTNAPCPNTTIKTANGQAGTLITTSATLNPGTYYAWIGSSSASDYIQCGDNNRYWISLTGITCFPPSGVAVSAVGATTATLSWSAASPAPSGGYQYEVRTGGAAGSGSAGLILTGTTLPGVLSVLVSGLTPNTDYNVYVRSGCGGSSYSSWTNSVQFTTPNLALNSVVQTVVLSGQANCYDALQTITVAGGGTAFVILSGGSASMVAGQKISYLPGTVIFNGGYLHGYIAPQGPFCTTGPAKSLTDDETGIPSATGQPSFSIYPNPTTGDFILEQKSGKTGDKITVEIFGIQGKKVLTGEMTGERKHNFSLGGIPAGMYFVKVESSDYIETIKLIKGR